MASRSRSQQMFSIDDAFEEEHTDAIRVYGATTTTEKSPLKPGRNGYMSTPGGPSASSDGVTVHVHEPGNPLNIKPIIRGLCKIKMEDTASKDSDSLIAESPEDSFDPSMSWWQHPKVQENWKMVFAAFSLLFIGVCLAVAGIVIISLYEGLQGVVFFITGVICFIPGAYHVIYIYLAVKGKRGYDFNFLPLFN